MSESATKLPVVGRRTLPVGSSVSFRLLNRTDTIRTDDEFLTDDCETWASVGDQGAKFMIGKPYSAQFFQPMRRREYPTNAIGHAPGAHGKATEPKLES